MTYLTTLGLAMTLNSKKNVH